MPTRRAIGPWTSQLLFSSKQQREPGSYTDDRRTPAGMSSLSRNLDPSGTIFEETIYVGLLVMLQHNNRLSTAIIALGTRWPTTRLPPAGGLISYSRPVLALYWLNPGQRRVSPRSASSATRHLIRRLGMSMSAGEIKACLVATEAYIQGCPPWQVGWSTPTHQHTTSRLAIAPDEPGQSRWGATGALLDGYVPRILA
ncbi:hypothetical protein LZ30DRAFT_293646 [Colletotrichum cereale]|nr:hypothetical protein LZ30DRAFT_293646 [Colletotrichum cereale]